MSLIRAVLQVKGWLSSQTPTARMVRAWLKLLLLATLVLGANAAFGQEDEPLPEEDPAPGMLDYMLTHIPEQDLSWVLGRALVGEHLWNNAAELVPDALVEATLPGYDGRPLISGEEARQMDAWVPDGVGRERALTVTSVLGDVTVLITSAGAAVMGVFGIFFLIQQTYGFASRKDGVKIGWAPARLGASMMFLMPVSKEGFCAIQALVVVCLQIGIGAANMTWDEAVSAFTSPVSDSSADPDNPDEDPALRAAREMLEIPAEELVAQAFAVGICRGMVNARAGQDATGGPPQYSGLDLRFAWNECGWLANSQDVKKQIRELADIYAIDGLADYLIKEVYEPRVAVLDRVQQAAAVWAARKFYRFRGGGQSLQRFDVVAGAAYLGSPVHLLQVRSHPPSDGSARGAEPVSATTIPAVTQALWAALEEFGSFDPGHAGACLAGWAGRLSGEDIALAQQTASAASSIARALGIPGSDDIAAGLADDRAARRGAVVGAAVAQGLSDSNRGFGPGESTVNGIPITAAVAEQVWPLPGWPDALQSNAGDCDRPLPQEFEYDGSPFYEWVWELENVGDPEALKDPLQAIYAEQFRGVSGSGEGAEGRRGWLMAGALYWQLQLAQRTDAAIRDLVSPKFDAVNTSECADAIAEKHRDANDLCFHVRAHNIGILTAQAVAAVGTDSPPAAFSYAGGVGGLDFEDVEEAKFSAGIANYLNGELQKVAASGTPLLALMDLGSDALYIGGALWGASHLAKLGKIPLISKIPGWGQLAKAIETIGPAMRALGITLLVIGILLGVWLPSLPVIAWLTAVWAWIVSIVLALLAAPLWALTHAIPDGHGPLSQYSRKGYELLLFATLRPLLLVVGLLLAISLSSIVVKLGAVMFSGVISSFADAAAFVNPSWVSSITVNVVLVTGMAIVFLLAIFFLVHKTFGLCHEVADKVFEWIGQGRSLGDSQAVADFRAMMVATARKAQPTAVAGGAAAALVAAKKSADSAALKNDPPPPNQPEAGTALERAMNKDSGKG